MVVHNTAISVAQANKLLPESLLLAHHDITESLLSLSTPADANESSIFRKVADFDRVETGADGTITAIQSTKRGTETVKLCTPVPTAGRPILEWLQALLAEVPSTMAQLFTASYKEGDTTPSSQWNMAK